MTVHTAVSASPDIATQPPKPPPEPHSRVGAYELMDTLGRGNFGKVRRARHVPTNQEYAVKIVNVDVLKQDLPGNLDIRREMSILRGLSHPNIVFLHEVMVSKSRVYMVMDLATGGDFFQLIRHRGRLAEPLARRYFTQLVDAVAYCHEHGVYHRDLKPENMLLTAGGNLKVTDFGFSAMKDHGGVMLHTNCGSPHYCAPEVWNGSQRGYDGEKADAFSVGVILFVLLSGGQPFYDADEDKLLQKVDRCEVTYPECLSGDAVDLLMKLLVRDPRKRWSLRMVKRHAWMLAKYMDDIDSEEGECGVEGVGSVGGGDGDLTSTATETTTATTASTASTVGSPGVSMGVSGEGMVTSCGEEGVGGAMEDGGCLGVDDVASECGQTDCGQTDCGQTDESRCDRCTVCCGRAKSLMYSSSDRWSHLSMA